MTVLEPWQTAWPAGAALGVLLAAALASRKQWWPRSWAGPALVFVLALLVRLVVVPALSQHVYDGHEAEFYDLFTGARERNRGGTVLYPAMQWLWWGLGRLLPHDPRVPVVLMAAVGAASAAVVGGLVRALAPEPDSRRGAVAGLAGGLVVAAHPAHAAWSSSAYNVALPFFFAAAVLWSGAVVGRSRRPPLAVATLGAAAWALVVATRMEVAVVGLPAAILALSLRPEGPPAPGLLRRRLGLAAPLAVGVVLGALAAWPLLFPGELPGTGERGLMWGINLPIVAYYLMDGWAAVWLVACGMLGLLGARRAPVAAASMALLVVGNHALMATFDDLGGRHLLVALPGLAWAVGGGLAEATRWRPAAGIAGLVGVLALLLHATWGLAGRYYASEEAFVAHVDATWPDLPRWRADEARAGCGWINEDPRYAADPVASHFNVLAPDEAEALRGDGGCLRWCADVQDWRWSSRGVADRARRMHRLYDLTPAAMVSEPGSGYACVVWDVGARRCCPPGPLR